MSTGGRALAWIGIVSLAVFLSSSLLAIWIGDLDRAKSVSDIVHVLLSWPVIAAGLTAAGAYKFGDQIKERLARSKNKR